MTAIGTPIEELDTPCMLIDLDKLEANIRNWQATIAANGVNLRPHVKTHKVPEIAHMQLAAGSPGITVAKVSEAEVFAEAGCNNIFIAYPTVGPAKWKRAAELAREITLIVGVDSLVGAQGLSAAAQAAGSTIQVRVEIDTGLNRSGIPAENALELCRAVQNLPNLELDGLFTFRGPSFPDAAGRSAEELGREEGQIMVDLAEELRSAGIPIRNVSVGGTPTTRPAATGCSARRSSGPPPCGAYRSSPSSVRVGSHPVRYSDGRGAATPGSGRRHPPVPQLFRQRRHLRP